MINNDNENCTWFHTENKLQTLFDIKIMKSNTIINQINFVIQFHLTPLSIY